MTVRNIAERTSTKLPRKDLPDCVKVAKCTGCVRSTHCDISNGKIQQDAQDLAIAKLDLFQSGEPRSKPVSHIDRVPLIC